jgi:lipocalin
LEVAKKYGFATYDAFYMDLKYHPEKYSDANAVWAELSQVDKQISDQEANLTAAYRAELNKRILAAEIEAVKRLQENAKTMK